MPDAGTTITFTAGSNQITIPGPKGGGSAQQSPTELGVVTGLSGSFKRYTYRKSQGVYRTWTLTWDTLESTEKLLIEDFFAAIRGPEEPMTVITTSGDTLNDVRLTDSVLNFTREGRNQWGLSLTFEVTQPVT